MDISLYGIALLIFFNTAGSDFGAVTPTQVRFNMGDESGATRNVTVPIIGDEVVEPDETFSVSLIPQRPERDRGTSATITIIDDDSVSIATSGGKVTQVKNNSHALVH